MRVYAVEEESGIRFLRHIQCDHRGCSATISPHSDIARSGWTKHGQRDSYGTYEVDLCPEHS